jgi:hypothetical protein
MYVQESHAIALFEGASIHVQHLTAYLSQMANRNVTWNEWIRHTLQTALLQINIRAANLREFYFE